MNITKTNRPESLICEQQAKFVQERVLSVESNLSELHSAFSLFSRKSAKLRDATDDISQALLSFAEAETISKTMKNGLSEMANTMSHLGDIRDMEVQRLDKKVVEGFGEYEGNCRRAKDELKSILAARERELNHQRHLDRLVERNPQNRHQIAKAETDLIKARSEVSRNQKELEKQIDLFEKKKLKDVKSCLQDFIKTELALHAKALELYTLAYNHVSSIDEEQDLEDLKNALANEAARQETVKRTSFRNSSLQSIASLFSTPQKSQLRRGSTGTPVEGKGSTGTPAALDNTKTSASDTNLESRIVSLRDESEEDELDSPFIASSSKRPQFRN